MAAYFALWGLSFDRVWDNRGKIRPVYTTFLLFNQFGDRLLKADLNQPLLPAYAALRPDGALSLMIVNKDPATTYRATIDLQASAPLRRCESGGTTSNAGTPSDYAGPLAPLDITFPPYSTTMLAFPRPWPAHAGDLGWGWLCGVAGRAAGLAVAARADGSDIGRAWRKVRCDAIVTRVAYT